MGKLNSKKFSTIIHQAAKFFNAPRSPRVFMAGIKSLVFEILNKNKIQADGKYLTA